MNYYRDYFGDYIRDTPMLNLTEHGAYKLMMGYYYSAEKPLPLDRQQLYLMLRAMRDEDRAAVDKVLGLYFTQEPDGYHQKRIDQEIAVARQARENGQKGGRPKTGKQTGSGTTGKTGEETGTVTGEGAGSGHPPASNHQPPTTSPQGTAPVATATGAKPPASPDCPHEEIIALYERILPELAQVAKWTPARKSALQARWREDKRHQTLEWWERFFKYVKESDFLCGRAKPKPGERPFRADLEWLITQGNFVKVLERKYENQGTYHRERA